MEESGIIPVTIKREYRVVSLQGRDTQSLSWCVGKERLTNSSHYGDLEEVLNALGQENFEIDCVYDGALILSKQIIEDDEEQGEKQSHPTYFGSS